MKTKTFYLVRHGETAANHSRLLQGSGINQPLNEKGRAQASALAERFKTQQIDAIVSSDLLRAKETALMVKEFHPEAVFIETPALREISWVLRLI